MGKFEEVELPDSVLLNSMCRTTAISHEGFNIKICTLASQVLAPEIILVGGQEKIAGKLRQN